MLSRSHVFLWALAWTALAASPSAQQHRSARAHPNVLVIVLDDFGTDKLAFYGQTPPTCAGACQSPPNCLPLPTNCVSPYPETPNLDALRRAGIWFTHAYATPVCSSSRAYLQTGRYGFRTGIGRATSTVQLPGDYELPDSEKLLPELLREGFATLTRPGLGLPYRCGAFGKWHLSTTLPQDYGHAVENGFHRFYGSPGNVGNFFRYDKIEQDAGSLPVLVPIDGRITIPPYGTDTYHASVTGRDALEWINAQTHSFFAYVAFNPPHTPMQVPPESLVSAETSCELACAGLAAGDFLSVASDPPELLKLVYRAMIEAVDTEIGHLLDGIDPAKLRNTMVFVIGDNGTPDFVVDDPPHVADHAKGKVYELGVRVPLIVSGPLVPRPLPVDGWRSDALVSAVDLWMTIADITGANAALVVPQVQIDSVSFLPVIRDPLGPGSRALAFAQTFSPNGILTVPPPSCYTLDRRAMTDGVYKYIRDQLSVAGLPCGTATYGEELYHLPADPEETTELISAGPLTPEAAAELQLLRAEMDVLSGI